MNTFVLIAILASISPLLGALAARWSGRSVLDAALSAAGVAAAIVVLVRVSVSGELTLAGDWLVIDRLAAAWSVFALVVVGAIRSFARRQLAGDPQRHRFHGSSTLAASSGVALFCAGNLLAMVFAAVATSVAAAAVVGYQQQGSHRGGLAARTRNTLLAGDALLAVGVAIIVAAGGGIDFSNLAVPSGLALHAASIAVVAAALVRCSQFPAQDWLPRTLGAPTVSSAVLHAGMVNAGGVILIRFGPMVSRSMLGTVAGVAIATVGIVAASAVMRTRTEVKSALVWSTTAQMGFMIVQALIGLGAAAAAHLIAHGAYKSSLFLSSGSTLEHRPGPAHHGAATTPAVLTRSIAAILAAVIVAAAVWASGFDLGGHDGASAFVAAFTIFTLYTILAGPGGLASPRRPGVRADRQSFALLGVLAVMTFAYLAAVSRFESWIKLESFQPAGAMPMAVAVVFAVLIGSVAFGPSALLTARWNKRLRATVDGLARRPMLQQSPTVAHQAPSTVGAR